ncbi:hypothetical protein GUITHDRAFT_141192 [Guillardia theta CCMP2712]|uniref:Uncharacterized protein n=1 Tax=Guillardia theta (strain CCMP2712) TaxID=905079 RepID=L1J1X5_GUITC|nr:hypothetical protein GUITHDRAFT_141192 [Guillardia theta CCMP2712]EKX42521.1 hypothetical protein GUITHDRAFT_141192 [Guillardia theta CCMP2712]|eukprot:XP_005829501.1 hypothetical protein GUITHDRAFT_141192 [Guillardia theta CCMP2712]
MSQISVVLSDSLMERRRKLLEAASSRQAFSELMHEHASGKLNVGEILQGMSGTEKSTVWQKLAKTLPDDIETSDETTQRFVESLSTLGLLVLGGKETEAPDSMQNIVNVLHDNLLRFVFMSSTQDAISKFCEAWYLKEPSSRSEVVPQTILYLLMRAVSEDGKVSDVKRVYNMRAALECLEIGGESFRSVQESLMRAAIHPNFVLSEDGRRFLTFLLTLHPLVTTIIHKTIKSQIPRCRSSMLVQYGELYHAAWKRASGPVLHALEHDCVQDLAKHCIHASSPSLSNAIRQVLSVFHKNKKYKAVDEMLSRIYEPILWRSLKVANPIVRKQAAQLFAEVFPVQNPDAPNAEFEMALNQQINVLDTLIRDEVPQVREVGIQCVCRIISIYFDLLPVHVTTTLVQVLIKQFSQDAASPAVRVAVLRGMAFILNNHMSHPLLQDRLKLLGDLIHDKSERVRVAMCELLLKVRGIKSIRFFDIVPMVEILDRLAVDAQRPAITQRLAKLLLPSYLPINKPPPEQLARILALIKQNSAAAQVFFKQAGSQAPEQTCVNVLVALHHALLVYAGSKKKVSKTNPKKSKRGGESRSKRQQQEEEEEHQEDEEDGDVESFGSIAEVSVQCMSSMLETLRARLDSSSCFNIRSYLVENISSSGLASLASSFSSSSGMASALWKLAALMPEPGDKKLVQECLARARTLPLEEAAPLLDCVFHWSGQKEFVREACAELRSAVSQEEGRGGGKTGGKRRKTGGKSSAQEEEEEEEEGSSPRPLSLLLQQLQYVLDSDHLRQKLMLVPSHLEEMLESLEGALQLVEARMEEEEEEEDGKISAEDLKSMVNIYAKLCLHSHCAQFPGAGGAGKSSGRLLSLLGWSNLTCLPVLLAPQEEKQRKSKKKADAKAQEGGGERRELARRSVMISLMVATESAVLGRINDALAAAVANLCSDVLDKRGGACVLKEGLLGMVCKAIFQLTRSGLQQDKLQELFSSLILLVPIDRLRTVGRTSACCLKTDREQVTMLLRDSLGLCCKAGSSSSSLSGKIFSSFLLKLQEFEEESDIQVVISSLLSAVKQAGGNASRALVDELLRVFSSSDLTNIEAALQLLQAASRDKVLRVKDQTSDKLTRACRDGVEMLVKRLDERPGEYEEGRKKRDPRDVVEIAEGWLQAEEVAGAEGAGAGAAGKKAEESN